MSKISEVHPNMSAALDPAIRALDDAIALRQAEIKKYQSARAALLLAQAETAVDQVTEDMDKAASAVEREITTGVGPPFRSKMLAAFLSPARESDSPDSGRSPYLPPEKVG